MTTKGIDSKKKAWSKITFLFVVIFLIGGCAFILALNWQQRGSSEVTANVRLADGASEDEVLMSENKIAKVIRADKVIFNKADYLVSLVTAPDGSKLLFDGCILSGVYEPQKCSTLDGISYWVTLTEIK